MKAVSDKQLLVRCSLCAAQGRVHNFPVDVEKKRERKGAVRQQPDTRLPYNPQYREDE